MTRTTGSKSVHIPPHGGWYHDVTVRIIGPDGKRDRSLFAAAGGISTISWTR